MTSLPDTEAEPTSTTPDTTATTTTTTSTAKESKTLVLLLAVHLIVSFPQWILILNYQSLQ